MTTCLRETTVLLFRQEKGRERRVLDPRRVAIAAAMLLFTACTTDEDGFGDPTDGYPANAAEIAAGADWSNAEELTVELSEFGFSPEVLTFRTGRPYALTLVNSGRLTHNFTANGFFRAVATKSLLYVDAEAGFPRLDSISLAAGESKTLYFVPVTPGSYELTCSRPLHATFGMIGRIHIE